MVEEQCTRYNAGVIQALEKELISPLERERLARRPWVRSLVHQLLLRIANLRAEVEELRKERSVKRSST